MATIRSIVEGFLYPHIEYYTKLVYEGGEDTVIEGIPVLHEDSAFTHGALINATSILYIYYINKEDARSEIILKRLLSFIDITVKLPCVRTWGKLGILRALFRLYKAGRLSVIGDARLSALKALTDYDDFLDKEKIELIGYATNYYQVALAVAAYREAIGFDTERISDKIEEKFTQLCFPTADTFMDDEGAKGRFDRYSLVLSSEVSDLYLDLGRKLPENIEKNLKICAGHSLFMANGVGDGVTYGRSLSTHGDLAPAEILSSAISRGLLPADERIGALSYIMSVLEKLLYFWYDKKKLSFNIWWDGRITNDYRGSHRLLEVNMDLACHVNTLLENIKAGGAADERVSDNIKYPEKWEYRRINFDGGYAAYILRYADYLCMLPFIGSRVYAECASYNPAPYICGIIEGSPESNLPYLIPEYTDTDGKVYRPAHYTYEYSEADTDGGVIITAKGKLMCCDGEYQKTDIDYRQDILLSRNEITVEFEVFADFDSAVMITATPSPTTKLYAGGFEDSFHMQILDNKDFKTPHGAYCTAYRHVSKSPKRLGYKVIID